MAGETRGKRYREVVARRIQHLLDFFHPFKTRSIEGLRRGRARIHAWWKKAFAPIVAAAWRTTRVVVRDAVKLVRAFLRRHSLLLSVIIGLVLLLLALWKVPQWQVADLSLSAKDRMQLEDEARRTLAQILGGMVVLVGLYLTWRRIAAAERTVQVTEEGQITERFTRAIDQLGSDKLEIRLGGIYALERIARDSAKDHWPIMEVLTAYVRENARWREEPRGREGLDGEQEGNGAPTSLTAILERDQRHRTIGRQENKPPTDIQAILTVLGRRTRAHETREDQRLDLRGVDIRGASLIDAHLAGALLVGAHLEDADLINAHLEETNLREAHLEGARLHGAHLERANLAAARLEGAFLTGAYLEWTNFFNAHLEGADLTSAVGLTLAQILGAPRDDRTRFPDHIEDEFYRRRMRTPSP